MKDAHAPSTSPATLYKTQSTFIRYLHIYLYCNGEPSVTSIYFYYFFVSHSYRRCIFDSRNLASVTSIFKFCIPTITSEHV